MSNILIPVSMFSPWLWMKQRQNLLLKARTKNELRCECLSMLPWLSQRITSLGCNEFIFFALISFFLSALCFSTGIHFPCLFSDFSILLLLLPHIGLIRLSLPSLPFNYSCPFLWIPFFSSHPHSFPFPASVQSVGNSFSLCPCPDQPYPYLYFFFTSQMMTPPYFSLILGFLSCTFGFCHILSSSFPYCFIAARFFRLFIDQLRLIFSTSL